jgi:hypothetical protein
VIDVQNIVEVIWEQDKKRGRRFDISVRDPADDPTEKTSGNSSGSDSKKAGNSGTFGRGKKQLQKRMSMMNNAPTRKLQFLAETKERAADWVKALTNAVNETRAKVSRVSRKSRLTRRAEFSSTLKVVTESAASRNRPVPALGNFNSSANVSPDIRDAKKKSHSIFEKASSMHFTMDSAKLGSGMKPNSKNAKRMSHFLKTNPDELKLPAAVHLAIGKRGSTELKSMDIAATQHLFKVYFFKRKIPKKSERFDPTIDRQISKSIIMSPLKQKLWERIGLWIRVCLTQAEFYPGELVARLKSNHSFHLPLQDATEEYLTNMGYQRLSYDEYMTELSNDEGYVETVELQSLTNLRPSFENPPILESDKLSSSTSKQLLDARDLTIVSELLKDAIKTGKFQTLSLMYRNIAHHEIFTGFQLMCWLWNLAKSEQIALHFTAEEDIVFFVKAMIDSGFLEEFPPDRIRTTEKRTDFAMDCTYRMSFKEDNSHQFLSTTKGLELLKTRNFFHWDFWLFQLKKSDTGVPLKTIKKGIKSYSNCFLGYDIVVWFVDGPWSKKDSEMLNSISSPLDHMIFSNPNTARAFVNLLLVRGLIVNAVDSSIRAYNDEYIYEFVESPITSPFRAHISKKETPLSPMFSPSPGSDSSSGGGDFNFKETTKPTSAELAKISRREKRALNNFLKRVTSESFEAFFLELQDDKQLLSVVLHEMLSLDLSKQKNSVLMSNKSWCSG